MAYEAAADNSGLEPVGLSPKAARKLPAAPSTNTWK
jgi:hypothetical protein